MSPSSSPPVAPQRRRFSRRAGAPLTVALLLTACGGDSTAPPQPATVQVTAPTQTLNALGETVQLSAVVIDDRGSPMPGAPITWTTGDPGVVQVSSSGLATAQGAGTAAVTASSPPASGSVTLTVVQLPSGLELVAGGGQEGEVGLPLADPLTFRVTDGRGNLVPGVSVSMAVTRGGGSVMDGAPVTDAAGEVTAVWTLGTTASEPNELTATAGTLSRIASATARAGPPTLLQDPTPGVRTGLAGEPLPDSLALSAEDRFGNPVAGAELSWEVTGGGGGLSPDRSTTGPDGVARSSWTLGPNPGANEARGALAGVPAAVLQAQGLPNGVVAGTVTLSSELLSAPRPLAAAAAPWGWGGGGAQASRRGPGVTGVLGTPGGGATAPRSAPETVGGVVPGEWVVRFRPAVLGAPGAAAGFSPASAAAVAETMRAEARELPGVSEGAVRVEGASPVVAALRVRVVDEEGERWVEELRRDPRVAGVEPVRFERVRGGEAGVAPGSAQAMSPGGTGGQAVSPLVEERFFPRQSWHYGMVGLPRGWELTEGNPQVIVAVVDDGIRFDHVSVAPNLTTDGYDFVSDLPFPRCSGGTVSNSGDGTGPDPDPTIPLVWELNQAETCVEGEARFGGHGLHVAGTVAAAAGGLVGVAPRVRVRPVRAVGSTGRASDYDVAQGILYAAGLPADDGAGGVVSPPSRSPIVNLSLGFSQPSAVLEDAVIRATEAGSLLIASAGNEGLAQVGFPARYPQVVAVSALGPTAELASYSNRGAAVDLSAPGGELAFGAAVGGIWSAFWDFQEDRPLLAAAQGTSMAAPHVAGVAALVLSREPGLSPAQLRAALEETAVDLGAPGRDPLYGHGLVSAIRALTGGQGLPQTLRVHLVDPATGGRLATSTPGPDRAFRFPGLEDGGYQVWAGFDDRGDGITGRPGFRWGARGGPTDPSSVAIQGHGVRDGSLVAGFPVEAEPNDTPGDADALVVGGYIHGLIAPDGEADLFRIRIPAQGSYSFETGGWEGMCGWGVEVDTILELLDEGGAVLASNDDIDFDRERFCSRITTTLAPGTYLLRVTGYGVGFYTLRAW